MVQSMFFFCITTKLSHIHIPTKNGVSVKLLHCAFTHAVSGVFKVWGKKLNKVIADI